jgi:hypothetical protein
MKSKKLSQLWNKVLNVNISNFEAVLKEVNAAKAFYEIDNNEYSEMVKQLNKFKKMFIEV